MDKKTLAHANDIMYEMTDLESLSQFLGAIDGCFRSRPHIDVNSYVIDPIHTSLKIRTQGTREIFRQFDDLLRRRIGELRKELDEL